MSEDQKPSLSCREAGRLGGKKTAEKYGIDHFTRIGKMGGQKVRELIERAKEQEREG